MITKFKLKFKNFFNSYMLIILFKRKPLIIIFESLELISLSSRAHSSTGAASKQSEYHSSNEPTSCPFAWSIDYWMSETWCLVFFSCE